MLKPDQATIAASTELTLVVKGVKFECSWYSQDEGINCIKLGGEWVYAVEVLADWLLAALNREFSETLAEQRDDFGYEPTYPLSHGVAA